MAAFPISMEGPVFTKDYTVLSTSPELPGPQFTPGLRAIANEGGEWLFVKLAASQTVTAGDFLVVTSTDNTFVATELSNTQKALLGALVGVAGATVTSASTSTSYMWIQRAGFNAAANITTSDTANGLLHTTATGGRLHTSGTGGTTAQVSGVVGLATSASNLAPVMLNYPVVSTAD